MTATTQVVVQVGSEVSAQVLPTIYNTPSTTIIENVGIVESIINWFMQLI